VLVLCCAAGPRVFFAWRADPAELTTSIPDASTYLIPAQSLIERGAFLNKMGQPEVTRTPGYPAFVAILLLLTGGDLRRALILQAVVLSLTVVVFYWLARQVVPSAVALLGALLSAFSPWGAVLAGLPLADGLFLLLLALIFLALKGFQQTHHPVAAAAGGICVGMLTAAAVLVRPIWPLVPLVGVAVLVGCGIKRAAPWILVVVMLASAYVPLSLWRDRNRQMAAYGGLSDISGITTWRYLAARVMAHATGRDRFLMVEAVAADERHWGLALQEADHERWRRANAVFREHPVVTAYAFTRSAVEHALHPSPDVLIWARLSFRGDWLVLALCWGGLLLFAYLGWRSSADAGGDGGAIDRRMLTAQLMVCLLLTLSSGVSFAQGARLRAPLELIVPLLAAIGLSHTVRYVDVRWATPQRASSKR
jgi:4-amino-4-deoxy-L-arabinose transferase-like glycosyltransferase